MIKKTMLELAFRALFLPVPENNEIFQRFKKSGDSKLNYL